MTAGCWRPNPHIRGTAVRLKKKKTRHLTLADMRQAAAKFGGECLSTEYVSLRTRMHWRCAAGHKWDAQAQNIRRGKWCLRCSGKMRKTIEEMRALAESRGGECISRIYTNMATKLTWRCERGHRWKSRPHLVQLGQWCPRCANENRRKKMLGNTNAKRKKRRSGSDGRTSSTSQSRLVGSDGSRGADNSERAPKRARDQHSRH
jgi:hypothetical protein